MKIGVVGASGEVGRTMVQVLEESQMKIGELRLFASSRSAGTTMTFSGKDQIIEELTEKSMEEKFDYLLFSAGSSISKKFAPIAAKNGNVIIDNSSAFRMEKEIPLVIPEINPETLKDYQGIIANPNCSTIQMLLALNLVQRKLGIEEIVVSTYQSVSGAGNKGIQELKKQIEGSADIGHFPAQIFQNVVALIGDPLESGFTAEELKMLYETQKIFDCKDIEVHPTAVRVPVVYGHSESIWFRTKKDITLKELQSIISESPSVQYSEKLITPLEIAGSDITWVTRLRHSGDRKFFIWVVADNVRVGAATNAVRILQKHFEINR